MKCALHVHTNLSDGAMRPEEAVEVYQDLGFGAVAVTDHEFMLRDGYPRLIQNLNRPGIMVLAGVEVDYVPWLYQHLVRIQGRAETLHILAHPSAYYLEIREINQRIASSPFPIDALEITERGSYREKYDTPQIRLPKVATDDAHETGSCGRAWIETGDFTDPDALLRAVKAGDFEVGFFRGGPR